MITSDYFSYDMLIGGKSDSRMKTNTSPRKLGNLSALCIHTLTSSVEQNLSLYKQQIFDIRNRNETVPKIAYPIYFSWYQQFFSWTSFLIFINKFYPSFHISKPSRVSYLDLPVPVSQVRVLRHPSPLPYPEIHTFRQRTVALQLPWHGIINLPPPLVCRVTGKDKVTLLVPITVVVPVTRPRLISQVM